MACTGGAGAPARAAIEAVAAAASPTATHLSTFGFLRPHSGF
jgi:hypothetical protein